MTHSKLLASCRVDAHVADVNFRLVVDAVPCSAETAAEFKRVQVSLKSRCIHSVAKWKSKWFWFLLTLLGGLLMLGCLLQDLVLKACV